MLEEIRGGLHVAGVEGGGQSATDQELLDVLDRRVVIISADVGSDGTNDGIPPLVEIDGERVACWCRGREQGC